MRRRMNETLSPTLQDELRERLRALYGDRLDRAVLYGSYARGEATETSDVDVLVVLDAPDDVRRAQERAYALAHDLWARHGRHVSFRVVSKRTFEEESWPLFRNVRAEGVLLVPEPSPEATAALRRHDYPTSHGALGMKKVTEQILQRAHQRLKSAHLLLEFEDYNGVVSMAYYAMFHAASAALNEAGKAAKSHPGTHHLLYETYVRSGRLDAEHTSALSDLHEERLEADYEAVPGFDRAGAEAAIRRAERFVAAIEDVLHSDPGGGR